MNKLYCLLILIFTCLKPTSHLPDMTHINKMTYTLLALGDSYTIGESIALTDNFPNQVIKLLRKAGFQFQPPEIIAKTGWTTDELQTAIDGHVFMPSYDFVTLLIGVNDQYRNRTVEGYKLQFESLLQQALRFADSKSNNVIVLSIPDWGVTPFAEGRDRKKIADEIELYNTSCKTIAEKYKVHFIDITPGTREAENDKSLLANDGLHPSAKEYARWAEKIALIIKTNLKKEI